MLVRRVVSHQQYPRRMVNVAHSGGGLRLIHKSGRESRKVGRAVVVDVVGLKHQAGELLQQVVFFIGGPIRPDDTYSTATISVPHLGKAFSDQLKGFFPRRRHELPALADERLLDPLIIASEIEGIATLDTEKVPINPALVAIVAADNLHSGFRCPHAQRGFAAVSAMGAGGVDVRHLPGTRSVAVRPGSQSADRANVNAHAALFAL